jgi:hypothetical protein
MSEINISKLHAFLFVLVREDILPMAQLDEALAHVEDPKRCVAYDDPVITDQTWKLATKLVPAERG